MKFITKTKSLLYGMEFTHGLRRALMAGLGLVYFLSLGFDIKLVTTLFAISVIISAFFEFPTGALADYDSRKKSIIISFLLMAAAFFGIFAFTNFWLLAASWILGDIAWTFYSGAGEAWSIDALGYGKNKNKIVSLISKSYFFERGGQIVGGLIGLVVIAISFRFIWLVIAISNLLMCFIVIRYLEERNFKPEKVKHNYLTKALIKAKESFSYIMHRKNKQLRVLLLGSTFGNFAFNSFLVGMPLFFTEILKVSPDKLSGILGIIAVFVLISPLIGEKIAYKTGLKKAMILFVFIVSIAAIVFSLSHSIILAITSLIFLRMSSIIVGVLEDSAYQHLFNRKLRASLGSTNNLIWTFAYAAAVFLSGLAISFFGIIPTLLVTGVLIMIEAIIYARWLK